MVGEVGRGTPTSLAPKVGEVDHEFLGEAGEIERLGTRIGRLDQQLFDREPHSPGSVRVLGRQTVRRRKGDDGDLEPSLIDHVGDEFRNDPTAMGTRVGRAKPRALEGELEVRCILFDRVEGWVASVQLRLVPVVGPEQQGKGRPGFGPSHGGEPLESEPAPQPPIGLDSTEGSARSEQVDGRNRPHDSADIGRQIQHLTSPRRLHLDERSCDSSVRH